MKRKLKKRITAFLLCMVLVVCNSVSILADEPGCNSGRKCRDKGTGKGN